MTQASASSFRFIHAGDAHLGAGKAHGVEGGPDSVNTRLLDFAAAWLRLCQAAVDERVDAFLFAGDAFATCKPTPWQVEAFGAGLRVLIEARIPTILCGGNHDIDRNPQNPTALKIFDRHLGADVRVFDLAPGITTVGDVPIAVVPWFHRGHVSARRSEFSQLLLDEQNAYLVDLTLAELRGQGAAAEQQAGPLGSVLLAHAGIGGSTIGDAANATEHFREPILPLSELRGLPFVYQGFGHFHRAQVLDGTDGRIRYSGSPERIDFAERVEDKGAWLVTLSPEASVEATFISTHPRPFVDLPLEVPADWKAELAALDGSVAKAVVRVTYEASLEEAHVVDHAAIKHALYEAGAHKVHGPLATIRHTIAERESTLSEETDVLTGWQEYADLQGLDGAQRERLDRLVQDAVEVVAA